MTTVKAAFGGWIPFVNLDQGAPIPGGFVLQLSDKFRPPHVTDGFSQAVVFDHILDVQTLDTYDLVFAYDLDRESMLIVSSAVGNLFVNASNLETGFVSILRALFLLCVLSLSLCQLLL